MPRTKKTAAKEKKQKLSPAERSQIAKDRWAKIREAKIIQHAPVPLPPSLDAYVEKSIDAMSPAQLASFNEKSEAIMESVPSVLQADAIATGLSGTPINQDPFHPISSLETIPYVAPVETPAPQLAPVAPKKPKRYTGPKEFSVALKAAENRLAKAIVERAQAAGSLAALNAEIPSLLGIINALKGSGNYVPHAPAPNFIANDFQGNYFPNALSGGPNPAPVDPMDAIRAAMAAPPVSRAIGNAVQLSPDVVGTLEGPDDDNPDRFLTGEHAGGGWIGE